MPLLEPSRYKAAKGGRGGGKSHFLAELLVEKAVCNPNLRAVCIREIQKSLRLSVKQLVEDKIRSLGVSELFTPFNNEIRRNSGNGIIVFQGMQNHTADSIKSLEDFDIAWCEESQNLSQRSLDLLRPTIRKDGSEIWFSWNPEFETDPVDRFFKPPPADAIVVGCTIFDNPFRSETLWKEMQEDRAVRDFEEYAHVWLGHYKVNSKEHVIADRCKIFEFEPEEHWDGPYHGGDWGFSQDPTAAVRVWIYDRKLYIEYESYGKALQLDSTADKWKRDIPGIEKYVVRADNARPESISHVQRKGIPRLTAAEKWPGSVEDGIAYLRSFEQIVIHPRCTGIAAEARLWSYKTDRLTGDVLPKLADGHDHGWDAVRYALVR
ncbi:MAG: PBSX family phage terminase large subunit, partial [Leptolyngbya sp. SIO1D8]|nr:PBSX family phage terminase large subunit [Leptolyngbya sp. SIO1D8]